MNSPGQVDPQLWAVGAIFCGAALLGFVQVSRVLSRRAYIVATLLLNGAFLGGVGWVLGRGVAAFYAIIFGFNLISLLIDLWLEAKADRGWIRWIGRPLIYGGCLTAICGLIGDWPPPLILIVPGALFLGWASIGVTAFQRRVRFREIYGMEVREPSRP